MARKPPAIEVAASFGLGRAIVQISTTPLVLLDEGLRVLAASQTFCEAFDIAEASVDGTVIGALGGGEWGAPELRSILENALSTPDAVDRYEMDLVRPGLAVRHLIVSPRRVPFGDGSAPSLLMAVADMTEARLSDLAKDKLLLEQAILLEEVHHRVANSLQIIASILLRQARTVQSVETKDHLEAAHQRVMSIAVLQRQLQPTDQDDVEIGAYLNKLCESLSASMIKNYRPITLTVTCEAGKSRSRYTTSLGLIVTELVINSLKHAFPDDRQGSIDVTYKTQGADWTLVVEDDGVGMSAPPGPRGLGTGIVEALAQNLNASFTVVASNPGVRATLSHVAAVLG